MGQHYIITTLLILDALARSVLALRVIMRRQPVPTSLAWLVLLFFLPFLSLFFYLLFGEHRLGARRARRMEEVGKVRELEALEIWQSRAELSRSVEAAYGPIARLCSAVSGFAPVGQNQLELMDDATQVLTHLARDIDASKHHCHLLYYIWQPANGGRSVGEALIRAAKRGVMCRVLVDAVGSKSFVRSDLFDQMVEAGVQITEALPVNPLRMLFARIDLRNHRKIAVIDGVVGYCGSQNLTDETFRHSRRRKVGPWIDATTRILGPAVHALQTVFLRDWQCDSEEEMGDLHHYFPSITPEAAATAGDSVVHVVPSGPGSQPQAFHQAMLSMLYAAKQEIVMTTPYFVPDEATKAALVNAALRGVSVVLVLPHVLDARVVAAASRSHYEDLLEAGVTILHHMDGLLHAKTATIDRELALVTSANLDMRSFWLNFEVSLFVYDDDFAGLLRFLQTKYIDESETIYLEEWRKRSAWKRLCDSTAQLLGPLL